MRKPVKYVLRLMTPTGRDIDTRHVECEQTVEVLTVSGLAGRITDIIGDTVYKESLCGHWRDVLNSIICEKMGNRFATIKIIDFGDRIPLNVEVEKVL